MKKFMCFIMCIILASNCLGMTGQQQGQAQGKVVAGLAALGAIGTSLYCYIKYNRARKCTIERQRQKEEKALKQKEKEQQELDQLMKDFQFESQPTVSASAASESVAPQESLPSPSEAAGSGLTQQQRDEDLQQLIRNYKKEVHTRRQGESLSGALARPAVAPNAPPRSSSPELLSADETPGIEQGAVKCPNIPLVNIGYLMPEQSSFGEDEEVTDGLLKHRSFYINAIHQQSIDKPTNKCGYMALFNAWAVQKLMEGEQAITVKNIIEKALEKTASVCDRKTNSDELLQLAREHMINSFYIAYVFQDDLIIEAQSPDTKEDVVIKKFKEHKAQVGDYLHFIGDTGAHWVLVTVIKVDCEKPIILYMNSLNSPLTKDSWGYKYLKSVWKYIQQSDV